MHCHEIMTANVESVRPNESVALAARKMLDRMLGFLPVCDEQGRPVGVLTDRDLAVRVCAHDRPAASTTVEEVMTCAPLWCRDYDPVARAEHLMCTQHKARVLVIDRDGRLVGVLSLTDLAQHEEPLRAARVLREVTGRAFRFEGPRTVRSVPPPDPSSGRRGQRRSDRTG